MFETAFVGANLFARNMLFGRMNSPLPHSQLHFLLKLHRAGSIGKQTTPAKSWFEERAPKCCLIAFIDDATSRLMRARFVPVETSRTALLAATEIADAGGGEGVFA